MNIEPKQFAFELLKKGGGVERWARLEREHSAASSTVPIQRRVIGKPPAAHKLAATPEPGSDRTISFKKSAREKLKASGGTYVLIATVSGGGDKVCICAAARLSAGSLGNTDISDALDHARRWARKSGRRSA